MEERFIPSGGHGVSCKEKEHRSETEQYAINLQAR